MHCLTQKRSSENRWHKHQNSVSIGTTAKICFKSCCVPKSLNIIFKITNWCLKRKTCLKFKGGMSRIFLKNIVSTRTKIIPLNHHLWPTRSVRRCLYLWEWDCINCSEQVPDRKHVNPPAACVVSLSRGGGANFECCVHKPQPTNPTHYTFKPAVI